MIMYWTSSRRRGAIFLNGKGWNEEEEQFFSTERDGKGLTIRPQASLQRRYLSVIYIIIILTDFGCQSGKRLTYLFTYVFISAILIDSMIKLL
jgi:hypothetical protein